MPIIMGASIDYGAIAGINGGKEPGATC